MAELSETIKSMFDKLNSDRTQIIERAENNSEITIPSILPDEALKEQDDLTKNYTSLGATGCKNLANKLLLALMPSNTSFFKLEIDEEFRDTEENDSEILKKLNEIERKVLRYINTSGMRVPILQSLLSLIITGNSLLYIPNSTKNKEKIRVFKLHNYVVERDAFGNVLRIITKEIMSSNTLPEEIRDSVMSKYTENMPEEVELYTMLNLNDDGRGWEIRQEIEEVVFNENLKIKYEDNPYIALRYK